MSLHLPDVRGPSQGEDGHMLSQLTRQKAIDTVNAPLTIPPATAADAERVARLAELDSSAAPEGDILLAEVNGELWAALSMDSGAAVGDPFRPSSEAVWM